MVLSKTQHYLSKGLAEKPLQAGYQQVLEARCPPGVMHPTATGLKSSRKTRGGRRCRGELRPPRATHLARAGFRRARDASWSVSA